MPDSDSLYHRMFSYPIMVEQLVREFVPEVMAVDLDFSRMELVNVKYHSRKGKRRESDVVWRMPTKAGAEIYIYLLFEFQSTIYWWMVVRIQVYVGMLWQQIIKEKKLKEGDTLPTVLPIVLYNGTQKWDAPRTVTELMAVSADSPLWPWQPKVQYYLLDEGAFPRDELARRETLAALLFRLEHCHHFDDLRDLIEVVIGWFRDHPGYEDLKLLFTELIQQMIKGTGMPVPIPHELMEMKTMFATLGQEWKRQWKAEGIAEGKAEGLVEGKASTLLRQLGRRFPMFPSHIETLVRAATNDQLDEWSDRILDARELSDVFGPDWQH